MAAGLGRQDAVLDNVCSIMALFGGQHVTQVLVHSVLSEPSRIMASETIVGVESYPERALLLARPHDIVCVPRPPDADFLQFLAGMGLGPDRGNIVIASSDDPPDNGQSLSNAPLCDPAAMHSRGNDPSEYYWAKHRRATVAAFLDWNVIYASDIV